MLTPAAPIKFPASGPRGFIQLTKPHRRNASVGEGEAPSASSDSTKAGASLAEAELEQPLNNLSIGDYEAALDAVLATYGDEDD